MQCLHSWQTDWKTRLVSQDRSITWTEGLLMSYGTNKDIFYKQRKYCKLEISITRLKIFIRNSKYLVVPPNSNTHAVFFNHVKCQRWWIIPLQWRHDGRDGVSNHQPHDCWLNFLSRRRSKKTSNSAPLDFVRGIHRWPVNCPHKWPVTLKLFPCDDVIMLRL